LELKDLPASWAIALEAGRIMKKGKIFS